MAITLAAPIIIRSNTHTKGGAKSMEAAGQLWLYAKSAGGKAYDSQTGFRVGPGDKMMSPDALGISRTRIAELEASGKATEYWPHLCTRGSIDGVAVDPETREIQERGEAP